MAWNGRYSDFIDVLEENRELVRVSDPVDWKYQLGHITRDKQEKVNPRALLFEEIKDYPGARVLTNGAATVSKIALALGLSYKTTISELADILNKRIRRPIPPVMCDAHELFDVTMLGEDVDLGRLPVPWWHHQEGGRYLGTWHINVSKDLRTGIRNLGVYRMMMIGPKQATVSTSSLSDLGQHIKIAEDMNRPLDMAVCIGVGEAVVMAGAAGLPYGTDEMPFAGGLVGEPLRLVRCKTIDMEVPDSSEFVLEGKILPHRKCLDGPYFDYTGRPKSGSAHIFEIECIKWKKNPIFRGAAIGIPGGEDYVLFSVLARMNLVNFHGSKKLGMIQSFLFKRQWHSLLQEVSARWY
ncbi:MAG TPA: UbiD family decarboxylase [Dissulfurispiraceae bacterium]|nr:UbiD family decarboxylase [Dissulfurispiraceae bacterium]